MILEGKTLGELRKPKELGRKGTNKFIWAACKKCGKERWVLYRYHILRNGNVLCRGCSIKNIQPWLVHEIGPKHWNWNGGKYLTKGKYKGYVNIWIDPSDQYYCMKDRRGYVLEHRLIMAQHIGRPLQKNEWIHHKNGIKTDNRIENLELTFNGKHIVEHHHGYMAGFEAGYNDGTNKKIQELEEVIRVLKTNQS